MSIGSDRTSSRSGEGARLGIRLAGTGEVAATDEIGSEISVDGVALFGEVSGEVFDDEPGGSVKGAKDRR